MALIGQMKYLTIGGSTYEIPSTEVEVTQTLASGTKIGEISVGSDSTNLYAPTPPVTSVNGSTGAVTIAVPTKTSQLTNDAGFITSADVPEGASAYTGTITAVGTSASTGTNNGFARGDHVHNITKTTIDTTLGTGSGTTKFYREDGSWATPAYTTNTDAKLQVAAITSGTTYYPIVGTGTTAATRQYDNTGFVYVGTNGTANGSNGNALLTLGNNIASTTANWKKGTIRLFGTTAYHTDLISGAPTADRTITFPNKTGTVALTSDVPTVPTNVSSFTNDAGYITVDEKVKISVLNKENGGKSVLFASGIATADTTSQAYASSSLIYNDYAQQLYIYDNAGSKSSIWKYNSLGFQNSSNTYRTTLQTGTPSSNVTITLPTSSGTLALTSDIDGKWNGVELSKSSGSTTGDGYVPFSTGTSATSMSYTKFTSTPAQYAIAKYNANSYLISTTPSANDNSTKVATTAYVDAATANAGGAQVQIVRW